ncbi:ABC transporter ATP-binding protein [Rhodocaloribacter litoris]|uniref:ABC transporter ATP-binding protein n=1 Tax=Rhodocaloribacter litoris TaxID=2558931 RepID=UPI00141EE961|nr:ABC transporter ATP-binding protein [Rhodocaloribacter litoris]QXD15624.1 ABC transporter ATP-binding protein [Rhodocaloribacter litoris]GIV61573.1 MAG: hemin ABC transporter ATP-binding protein [Rhodothermaceae bacterium]
MPALVAENLSVVLDGKPVLRELGFTVEAGTWVGLLGPNGSGKTTLLRAIGGLLPYAGTLRVLGREVRAWKPQALARHLAFVRQSASLLFDFTVEELVLLGRAPHKGWLETDTRADRERVRRALARVDLAGFEKRSMLSLSGGEQQRVFLAQALVQEAELLLLDEPTAHLDVHHQFEFIDHVRGLVRAGCTVIAAFHDLELAARFADRILVLDRGRLAAAGPPARVLTADLIAGVFRMEARLYPAEDGSLRIHYVGPLAACTRAGNGTGRPHPVAPTPPSSH